MLAKYLGTVLLGFGVICLSASVALAQISFPCSCDGNGSCSGSVSGCSSCSCCSIPPAAKTCTCCTVTFDCQNPGGGWNCSDTN